MVQYCERLQLLVLKQALSSHFTLLDGRYNFIFYNSQTAA